MIYHRLVKKPGVILFLGLLFLTFVNFQFARAAVRCENYFEAPEEKFLQTAEKLARFRLTLKEAKTAEEKKLRQQEFEQKMDDFTNSLGDSTKAKALVTEAMQFLERTNQAPTPEALEKKAQLARAQESAALQTWSSYQELTTPYEKPTAQIRISPDGTKAFILSGEFLEKMSASVLDLKTMQISPLPGESEKSNFISAIFSKDQTQVLSLFEKELDIYDLVTHEKKVSPKFPFENIYRMALSPDGTKLILSGRTRKKKWYSLKTFLEYELKQLDLKTMQVTDLPLKSKDLIDVWFLPDGSLLTHSDHQMRLTNSKTRERLNLSAMLNHSSVWTKVQISRDGKRFVVIQDRLVTQFDLETRKILAQQEIDMRPARMIHLSEDGQRLIYVSDQIHDLNLETTTDLKQDFSLGKNQLVQFAVTPDESELFASTPRVVKVIDLVSGLERVVLDRDEFTRLQAKPRDRLNSVEPRDVMLTPDGSKLFVRTAGNRILFYSRSL